MRFKIVLLTLFATLFQVATAQSRKVQFRPYIDQRKFHYGFYVGLHDQGLKLRSNDYVNPQTGEQWIAENDSQNLGFNVGILTDWKINDIFSFRLTPGLYFGSKHLRFNRLDQPGHKTQDMKSCFVALPVELKTAAPRFNNYRPYAMVGLAPMYDLIAGKNNHIKTKPFTLQLEVGLGCDLYLPFFKLIPELKFSFGLNNILDKKRKDLKEDKQRVFTQSVDKATANMVTLSFYFE